MKNRASKRNATRGVRWSAIAWLICCTACTSEMTVALENEDDPIGHVASVDSDSESDSDTDGNSEAIEDAGLQSPPPLVEGPRASICAAATYPDTLGKVQNYMQVRELDDERIEVLADGDMVQIDFGDVPTTENRFGFGPDAIIAGDGRIIDMYQVDDAEDWPQFNFYITQKDGDVVDWTIRIPQIHYDPASAGADYSMQDKHRVPVFNVQGDALIVAALFTGTMILAEGQVEEKLIGSATASGPQMLIAQYDRADGTLLSVATVDAPDLLVPETIVLNESGDSVYIAGWPFNQRYDAFAIGRYSILGTPIWVNNTGTPPETIDAIIGFSNLGVYPTSILERPDGGVYVQSTFFGSKRISDRFGADVSLEAPFWQSEDGNSTSQALAHFIAAFDEDGVLLWAQNDIVDAGYQNTTTATTAALLGDYLLVGGALKGNVTLGIGEIDETTLAVANGGTGIYGDVRRGRPYLAAYQPGGTLAWARIFEENFVLGDMAVLSDDTIRVYGTFDTQLDLTLPDQDPVSIEPGSDPALGVGLIVADVCPE